MIDPATRRDRGFAMVALLIGMSVAAIWMTAALPAWRQQAQRQKEEDLIFRGEQYARAIVLYHGQEPQRVSAQHRRARGPALPSEKVEGSDHEQGLHTDAAASACPAVHSSGSSQGPGKHPAEPPTTPGRGRPRPAPGVISRARQAGHHGRSQREHGNLNKDLPEPAAVQPVGV